MTKEGTTKIPDLQAQRIDTSSGGRTCHYCENSHKPQEYPACGKQCLNCGIMNHYAEVCNKRESPRNSPNKPSFSLKRPQSPRNNQFRHQNGSKSNKLELEFDQITVIQNLQEQLNQLQMQQQQEINAHSLRSSPISAQLYNSKLNHPPRFFISRKEANMPQTIVKMMQTETIEVWQLSERNSEHI